MNTVQRLARGMPNRSPSPQSQSSFCPTSFKANEKGFGVVRALAGSGLQRMELHYKRGGKSFIRRHSRETGRLLEDLGVALQGAITFGIESLTGHESILPEDDWTNQFRAIFARRPIPKSQIAKRMDLPWTSFAAYFTSTKRLEETGLKRLGSSHISSLPPSTGLCSPSRPMVQRSFQCQTGVAGSLTNNPDSGLSTNPDKERLQKQSMRPQITPAPSADCISALLSIFGVQLNAHSDTSWEALRAVWRTYDSVPRPPSSDAVSSLLHQAQGLHDRHDFVGACLLSNIAQVLLGTGGNEKEG